jgi:hypothetical protein
VGFDWNNLSYNTNFAENDHSGGIAININWFVHKEIDVDQDVTTKGWANMLAHEGVWGNVAGKDDDNSQGDYDIASGHQSNDDTYTFTATVSSKNIIVKACGF